MKNPITYWLKRIILLVLILVQVGNLYAADKVLTETEITTPESAQGQEFVNSWRVLEGTPLRFDIDGWLPRVSSWLDEGLQVGVKETDGVVRIFGGGTNPLESGVEIARISQKNGDEIIEILEDGFLPLTYPSSGAIVSSKGIDLPVIAPCQSIIPNVSLARMSNGQIGFISDLSQYSAALVKKALTSPYYHLRKALEAKGLITVGEQGHHVLPIQVLRNNLIAQDAVEAGFDFNGIINGKGLRSIGENPIHLGSHDYYNFKVDKNLIDWAEPLKKNGTYTKEKAKKYLEEVLVPDLKKLMDDFPDTPINNLLNDF